MFRRFAALFFLTCGGLCAQTATDTNLGSKLTVDSTTSPATYTFSWWGTTGCHYLVQHSSDLLLPWSFLPNYNPSGANAVLRVQFTTDAKKYFFRTLQFDPNDVPASIDTDGDGLPDQWELYYFGNLSRNGTGDWNNDGMLDRDAFRYGLDPFKRDNDGDGMIDGYEITMGLNPLLSDGAADKDGDLVINQEDARPNDPAIGRLSVAITAPADNSILP
jgi:hypothetical protein